MRSAVSLSLALACLAAGTAAAQEVIPGSEFESPPWTGDCYAADGVWTHCAISASYEAPMSMLVFVILKGTGTGNDLGLRLVMARPVFEGMHQLAVTLRIDRSAPVVFSGVVANDGKAVDLYLADVESWLPSLRRGTTLYLDSAVGSVTIGLNGTNRALAALQDHVAQFEDMAAIAEVEPPPITVGAPTVPATTPAAWVPTPDETAQMYQIATSIITKTGQRDFFYLTPAEIAARGFEHEAGGVMWQALGGRFVGGVWVGRLKGEAIDIARETAGDMASMTLRCTGELTSSNRSYPIGGRTTTELVALCSTPKGSVETTITRTELDGVLVETYGAYMTPLVAGGTPAPAGGRPTGETAARAASLILQVDD